jgi:hypothetical protein
LRGGTAAKRRGGGDCLSTAIPSTAVPAVPLPQAGNRINIRQRIAGCEKPVPTFSRMRDVASPDTKNRFPLFRAML